MPGGHQLLRALMEAAGSRSYSSGKRPEDEPRNKVVPAYAKQADAIVGVKSRNTWSVKRGIRRKP